MPFTTRSSSSSSPRRVFIAAVLCVLAPVVQAQQAGNGSQGVDQVMVVSRTVQPRNAFRGVPLEDNPVRVQATTFPGRVFHNMLDAGMEQLVGDGELTQLGSAGIDGGGALHGALPAGSPLAVTASMFGGAGAGAATPLGSAPGPGGAVSAATRGLDGLIRSSLLPVLGTNTGGGQ